MGKTKTENIRSNTRNNKKRKVSFKPKKSSMQKKKEKIPIQEDDPVIFGSAVPAASGGSDSEPESSDRIQRLLEPYTKDQLIDFLLDAAASDPDLVARIRSAADSDVSHRKIFVHGLSWDSTRENLVEAFSPFGPIEDCNVVFDKVTGRAKGYGFVLFKIRSASQNALKQPLKRIKNRLASCQLASVGPGVGGGTASADGRRIYVSNVYADAPADKLKSFFAKFGEVESGPIGYDMITGKSKGFAIFVYKSQEGAKKALQEPHKMFEGHQLHCQLATDSFQKRKAVGAAQTLALASLPQPPVLASVPQPVLAAVAAAQNLALYHQNPAYAAFFGQNPLLAAAALNAGAAGMLSPAVGQGYGAAGLSTGAPSVLGAYGSQEMATGLYGNQGSQVGQSLAVRPGASFGGFNSYIWYNLFSSLIFIAFQIYWAIVLSVVSCFLVYVDNFMNEPIYGWGYIVHMVY